MIQTSTVKKPANAVWKVSVKNVQPTMTVKRRMLVTCAALRMLVYDDLAVVSQIWTARVVAAGAYPAQTTVSAADVAELKEVKTIATLAKFAAVVSAFPTTHVQTTASVLQARHVLMGTA